MSIVPFRNGRISFCVLSGPRVSHISGRPFTDAKRSARSSDLKLSSNSATYIRFSSLFISINGNLIEKKYNKNKLK